MIENFKINIKINIIYKSKFRNFLFTNVFTHYHPKLLFNHKNLQNSSFKITLDSIIFFLNVRISNQL
jgi:hypothetical protein